MAALVTATALAGLAWPAARAAQADELVRIGEAAPVTGPASYLGKDTENGARLAVEEINRGALVIGG
ncbi:branched-chain amino acid ABC transporter substrate-binding protein, partial [Burkholderia gladioli]|nr:branched-chain amino acid ABC transporter substrate-binding protein [Burkholderia gladioli]